MNEEKVLDISWGTILKFALAGLFFYTLYLIRDILILIVFSLIISVLFSPAIDFFAKRKIPRSVATILIYLFVFGLVGLLIRLIAPVFVNEIKQLAQVFPQYFERLAPTLKDLGLVAFSSFENFTKALGDWVIKAQSGIISAIAAIFGSIFSTLTIFSISIFLSLEEKSAERIISLFFPKKYEATILGNWERAQKGVVGWFASRIISCIFVGLLTFVTCKILSIDYAVAFGLLAGVTNMIPVIGPLVAGAIIMLFAFLNNASQGIFFGIIFVLIHQIEGNVLTPILSKKFIGIPPVLVLISLLIGARLWGILGAILAIPLFGILFEFTKEYLEKKREEKEKVLVL